MQLIQNFAAKVLTRRRKFDSATMALMELHWLPVREWCKFKIMLMTYKALNNLSPKYLSELLSYTSPVYKTRSSNDDLLLNIPFTRRYTFADRSFACMATKLWNTLPYTIRSAINIGNFKSNLKTYIFKKAFNV